MIGKQQEEENISCICLSPIQTIEKRQKKKDGLMSHTVDFQ